MTLVRLKPAAPWSGVKHSTTEPLHSPHHMFGYITSGPFWVNNSTLKRPQSKSLCFFVRPSEKERVFAYVVGAQKNSLGETFFFERPKHMFGSITISI